ncbi:aminopeptidase P family N-terminal domain-containing protein [Microbacterium sp. ET2]|uniref:aminopeptidase P family N-terminal domain-containing protein n=1 Tax=Microbacterium albipurpureum TaxID=3050384 RepID=UPI00259D2378|nr:aminopeptidase P family N-terminal domain-containing protein [Microbacterium sp. ET2 (Ac-2212)]WJL96756.1 aminopeptidase P family N-terminal domain-containing protein [Microbacterium sp. ET2 (Ac-2212)]
MTQQFELREISLPKIELPRELPRVAGATYEARIAATEQAMADRGLGALVVYADREHFANLAYLTGFDPRYEEALLVLVPGRKPRLFVGNEDEAYADIIEYDLDVIRFAKLSLTGQPDTQNLALGDVLREAGLAEVGTVGVVGWKWYQGAGTDGWIDVPHYIVVELQRLADRVVNATDIFTGYGTGLRYQNEVDQVAYFEFVGGHGSQSVINLISGIRPGMTELEASQLLNPYMLPFNYHPTMLGGPNTRFGVASAGSRELQLGDRVASGLGYWGSNTARAGYLVEDADQLPADAKGYVQDLVIPYFATAAAWYENVRIGMTAGEMYDITFDRIGDPYFGVFLNPGHFIHLDEWPGSPVAKGSDVQFQSGNAIQLDIIPMVASGAHHTSQIEDGIVLADEQLRAELAEKYPGAWDRIQARRAMLSGTFGIELHEEVLPLSNAAGYLPPFWLAPNLSIARV